MASFPPPSSLSRGVSNVMPSAMDAALGRFHSEADAVSAQLKLRAEDENRTLLNHPASFIENFTSAVSVEEGCLFVGHINTDMDSVGGAVGAAALYKGRATLAQLPSDLNGEIMYALSYARTGEKQEWTSADIEAWKKSVHGKTAVPGFGTTGDNTADDDKSLIFIGEVFDDQSRVCLVDHNAPSQMVAPLKKKIIEEGKTDMLVGIIDHHALDENIYTKGPLFMDIRPWGSMSTIIFHSFLRSARPIPIDVARLLLCAIMSDTVNLTSPTTTYADRYMVPLLCRFCEEEDHNRLAQMLFRAKTAWFVTLSAFECVRADQKDFTTTVDDVTSYKWGWATVEVNEPEKLLEQYKSLLLELNVLKQEKELHFAFLSIVDLTNKRSDLLLCGDNEASLARAAFGEDCRVFEPTGRAEDDEENEKNLRELSVSMKTAAMDVGARTSRKKQFKPSIDKALQKGWRMKKMPSVVVKMAVDDENKQAETKLLVSPKEGSACAVAVVASTEVCATTQKLKRRFSLEEIQLHRD